MTSPAYVSSAQPPGGNTATTSVGAEPAGAAINNILQACLIRDPGLGAITPPVGWTQIGTGVSTTDANVTMWWIRRGGSAPPLTWSWVGSATYSEVNIVAASGAIASGSPIDSFAFGTPQTTGTVVTPPPVAILSVNTLIIAWAINWLNGWTALPAGPTGYTSRLGGGQFDTVAATKATSATGTTTPNGFGPADGSSPNVGVMVVLASQAPPVASGASLFFGAGTTS